MKIAITGTIGSGKSTVCNYLRSLGYEVFSCDDYNSYLLQKGNEGYLILRELFPECFKDDELDKKLVAKVIFKDQDKRKLLEAKLHPLILDEMLKESKKKELFFAEVPLLFEVGQDKYFDYSWLVIADEEETLDRLVNRGMNLLDAKNRIKSQMSVSNKKNKSNEIIYNNKDLKDLYSKVDTLLTKYVR